jgi:3-oxoadipate enol-lactonase
MPDLRAHGDSEAGDGPAIMEKMAADLALLCREERIARGWFVGVSIGGYVLFEFWRRYREHVGALVLANTRAAAETPESRVNRLAMADKVLREGTAGFIAEMLSKLMSPVTMTNRPDIVDAARRMMQQMSPQDIAAVQQGMADRPDSVPTLRTIDVPTLIIASEDDSIPRAEFELMRQQIPQGRLNLIPRAGHYAALEQPDNFAGLLRSFFDNLPR